MIREATSTDIEGLQGLYAQLQLQEPSMGDGTNFRVFKQIPDAEHLKLFVFEDA